MDTVITYEEVTWQKALPCKNYDPKPLAIGQLVGKENTLVVSLPPSGSCVLYCMAHQMIYKPNAACPECTVQAVTSE